MSTNYRADICPVCGMKADPELDSVEYYKIYFHFCSTQCRENFLAHPRLYQREAQKGRKEIIKQRTMHLAEPIGKAGAELLIPYLMKLMGVKNVIIEGDTVSITYDLLQVTEVQIEKALAEAGAELGGSWLAHFRRGWIHDSEENELDNLASPPARSYHHTPSKL
ncbi:MAG TPA: YHS domain-containing protein [Gammaproteobacteria bacterium]|nr:YHS domain-containing protein [Gammaproteobacteria bacterium]